MKIILKQKEGKLSEFINNQNWIVKFFAVIGAGFILYESLGIFAIASIDIKNQFANSFPKVIIVENVSADFDVREVDEDNVSPEMLDSQKNGIEVGQASFLIGEFSAYNSEEGQTDADPFTMASGKRVYDGAIANNCLDFGQKIEINEKIYTVEDRMNRRYGCEYFDIWFESYDEAIEFGRKEIEYKIL